MVKDGKFTFFVVASIFAVPFSGVLGKDLWEVQYHFLFLCFSALVVIAISNLNKKSREIILKSFVILVLLQGVLVALQLANIDPLFDSRITKNDLPFGCSGSPNQSALFFGVTLPIVLAYCPIAGVLSGLGLFVAKTTSVWLGTLSGLLVMCTFYFKRATKYLVLVVGIATISFYYHGGKITDGVMSERVGLYKTTIKQAFTGEVLIPHGDKTFRIKSRKWMGFGPNSFQALSPFTQSEYLLPSSQHRYFHAHNDYLEIWFEYGYIGLAVIMFLIGDGIRRFVMAEKNKTLIVVTSCLVVHLVSALGIFTIHTATSGMLFIIMYGLFIGETSCKRF